MTPRSYPSFFPILVILTILGLGGSTGLETSHTRQLTLILEDESSCKSAPLKKSTAFSRERNAENVPISCCWQKRIEGPLSPKPDMAIHLQVLTGADSGESGILKGEYQWISSAARRKRRKLSSDETPKLCEKTPAPARRSKVDTFPQIGT